MGIRWDCSALLGLTLARYGLQGQPAVVHVVPDEFVEP